jgi:hypothetical protein
MTLMSRSTPPALLACALMTASCAASPPTSAAPPRLTLPREATTPCRLDRLPEAPTLGDLESSYMTRGLALAECDAARRLAVETLLAERALQDRWRSDQSKWP